MPKGVVEKEYWLVDFIITMFSHQSDQFVTCRLLHCDYRKLYCDYKKTARWLQKIALLFGINCTEINQSHSSNIYMYIIKNVIVL
jgi:hypothetical protein